MKLPHKHILVVDGQICNKAKNKKKLNLYLNKKNCIFSIERYFYGTLLFKKNFIFFFNHVSIELEVDMVYMKKKVKSQKNNAVLYFS